MITSTKNTKVKEIRSLQGRAKNRKESGRFVVEGVRLIEEAFNAGWPPEMLLYSEDLNQRGLDLVGQMEEDGVLIEMAAPHVMKAVSETKNPQGILAILSTQDSNHPESINLLLVLDQIRDPGNLGTLLRTAAAAGAQAVYIPGGTTDVFSPKVLRSGMGAHFKMAILQGDYDELNALCEKHGLKLFVAEASRGKAFYEENLTEAVAITIGGEANGVSQDLLDLKPSAIRIPMPGKTESLNAAIAGAILLFEAVRQREIKQ